MLCASRGASSAYYSLLGASRAESTTGGATMSTTISLMQVALARGAHYVSQRLSSNESDATLICEAYYFAREHAAQQAGADWARAHVVLNEVLAELVDCFC